MSKKIKVIITAVVAIALIWLSVMPGGAIEIKRYYGDIDNDGYVTTEDARIALLVAAQIYDKELFGLDFEAADMNGDKKITTDDARLVLRAAAGQIEKVYMKGYEFNEEPEKFTELINDYRFEQDHTSIRLTLSDELCKAAKLAAQEYVLNTDTALVRSDGSYYYKILDEMGIKYTRADKMIVKASFGYEQTVKNLFADMQCEKSLLSNNFSKIGVGAYSADGRTFYWCVFLIK